MSTIYRRIMKRISLLQIKGIPEYSCYLETHPEELDALFRDLLIGVTKFFRDPEAFGYLEENILPELVNSASQDGTIRVWIPGCSTGEEAYSIAIILREVIDNLRAGVDLKLQIFATDIDDRSIHIARKGFYLANIASEVSPERLDKYFTEVESGYIVKKIIREMVVFASHDLVKDPPFTKMDIISCRNLLIYFNSDLQKKIIPTFYYSLNSGGILFLGTAESTGSTRDLFTTVSSKWKIYKRKDEKPLSKRLVDIPSTPPLIETYEDEKLPGKPEQAVADVVKRVLMERYSPPAIIIDVKR